MTPVFPSGFGQSDTRAVVLNDGKPNPSRSAGESYPTIGFAEIRAMAAEPPSSPKERARWFVPSEYSACDARSHAAQRERGIFWCLAVDIDKGNPALDDVMRAVQAVVGDAALMVYATRNAKPDDRRWRALVPLAAPISGEDYLAVASAFFDIIAAEGLEPDRAAARTAQLVYLPNRGAFYDWRSVKGPALRLGPDHPIMRRMEAVAADEAASAAALAEVRAHAAARPRPADSASPIDEFNAAHTIPEMFARYGYTPDPARDGHWRSPLQTSASFATRDYGDHWVSLSGSDAAAGLGRATSRGCRTGDAFDLEVYFGRRGDFTGAVRANGANGQHHYHHHPAGSARPPDPPPREEDPPAPGDPALPMFNVGTTTRHATCEDVRRLLAQHRRMFAFGGVIVEVDFSPTAGLFSDASKTEPAMFPHPVPITKDRAVRHIERVCGWQAWQGGKDAGWVEKPAPLWAAQLIANGSAERFPPLAGVIRHPVIDEDGKLKCGMLGYDPKSQYFIQAPLPQDVDVFKWSSPAAALDWLVKDWLGEFFWSDESDCLRAVMLCLTLLKGRTTLARHGKFPGFLVTAPMASTGKTELVECLTRAVTGEGIPFAAFPIEDDAEMNKLLMSIVMSDPSCFCFDNIKNGHSIRSAVLDQFITRDSFQGRLLGTNRMGDFPALAVVIATGNNIEAAEDSSTRFVEIRLQPKDDNPQNAVFLHDAKVRTTDLRPKILSALRAVASVKHQVPPKGRFKAWFAEVAGPVMELSGNRGLLDAWEQGGSTIRNADALEEFLAKIKATGIDPIGGGEIVANAFVEFAALTGSVKQEIYDQIVATPDPSDFEAIKRRDSAKNQVARYVVSQLKPWRDQIAGGLRLRFVRWKDRKGRERDFVSLSGRSQNWRSDEPELI